MRHFADCALWGAEKSSLIFHLISVDISVSQLIERAGIKELAFS